MKPITTLFALLFICFISKAQSFSDLEITNYDGRYSQSKISSITNRLCNNPLQETASEPAPQPIAFSLSAKQEQFTLGKKSSYNRYDRYESCDRYRKIKNIGGWSILGGGILSTAAVVVIIDGLTQDNYYNSNAPTQSEIGLYMLIAGDIIQLAGTIVAITGKIAYRHHRCALHLTSKGNTVGLAYHFNR